MRHLIVLGSAGLLFWALAAALYRLGQTDLLLVLASVAITAPLAYLLRDRVAQQNRVLQLKEEALRAELGLLKQQINPHFFFNTLNNLYGLTVAKSDLAPDMILKLADLMRYAIYEGRKDQVSLQDEIAYLQNYLDLQRIRSRPGGLDLEIDLDVDDSEIGIAPLMLIILVENAVKHGLAAAATSTAFIHLRLRTQASRLEFEVDNSVGPVAPGPGGLGLANLRRRLELIYPERHGLETRLQGETYQARLWLNL